MTSFSSSVFVYGAFICIAISGCASTYQKPNPYTSEQTNIQRDPLSYGSITAKVQKGITTQEEIIRYFGAPNITTMNKDGREVWMYDRISSSSQSDGWSEARRFGVFFGLETASAKQGSNRSSSTSTLTFIITFDVNKRVTDYSARATQF